eukprot:SAG11_NODE_2180_length_3714_cov_2.273306_2_plen_87_part_00
MARYPNVLMQSVLHAGATHARASADSHPSGNNYVGFAGESTWIWALGLWPFKDTFYSNRTELTQNPYAVREASVLSEPQSCTLWKF